MIVVIYRNATDQDSFVLSASPNTFVFLGTPKTTGSSTTTTGVLPFVVDGASQTAKGGLRRVLLRSKASISNALPAFAAMFNSSSYKTADITLHTVLTMPQLYAEALSANRTSNNPVGNLFYLVLSQLIQYNTALIAGNSIAVPPAYGDIGNSALLNGVCGNLPILPGSTYGH